ncbi:putative short-chain dehydrogenase/reductase family protein [Penicillium brasilianum]|uniref:Putative short-chain dehydrogenase/reductase family protein n=1 Tax=Penicillium brasilianum TaxID=104259 RepID=A0A1S9S206_PENBI|nr:putative short-chain dehydrogenase/reductase family protein [Penicillium brasilianum]
MEFQDVVAGGSFVSYALRHPLEGLSSFGPTLSEATFGLCGSSFNPERDISGIEGKTIFVTGGNAGIGRETVLQLAKHRPARIYLAARTESKAQQAITSIQQQLPSPVDIRHIPLDLCSFKSIRAAAAKFQADSDRLDILILNAGTMGNPPVKTEDGFEIQFGTNHVGHFLLTKLLLPTLTKTVADLQASRTTPDVRVITVSSVAHVTSPNTLEGMTSTPELLAGSTWVRYGASKAANILFASELARRHPELLSVAVHPGAVNSDLYAHAKSISAIMKQSLGLTASCFFRNISSGAFNSLWAAGTARENLVNGAYYTPVGYRSNGTAFVQDADVARGLWDWTEAQVADRE